MQSMRNSASGKLPMRLPRGRRSENPMSRSVKKKATSLRFLPPIEDLIHDIRGRRVLLDADLAAIYGVTTAALNQAVKRNEARFPADFSFQLTNAEIDTMISQNVISKPSRGGRTKPPRVFTEHGALQAANVLRSKRAIAKSPSPNEVARSIFRA